jgi:hypothetical protein
MSTKTIHPFEAAGLGLAPFRYVGTSQKVHKAGGIEQPAGTCNYCGAGIRYCFHIKSQDGKEFVVGSDCIRKIVREDNRLFTAVERAIAKHKKAERETQRKAKWEVAQQKRELELQWQRDRNGGLTDKEVDDKARREEREKKMAETTARNQWLIDAVSQSHGAFAEPMAEELRWREVSSLSDPCVRILRDIYGRAVGGRSNTKAYKEAVQDFDTRVESLERSADARS